MRLLTYSSAFRVSNKPTSLFFAHLDLDKSVQKFRDVKVIKIFCETRNVKKRRFLENEYFDNENWLSFSNISEIAYTCLETFGSTRLVLRKKAFFLHFLISSTFMLRNVRFEKGAVQLQKNFRKSGWRLCYSWLLVWKTQELRLYMAFTKTKLLSRLSIFFVFFRQRMEGHFKKKALGVNETGYNYDCAMQDNKFLILSTRSQDSYVCHTVCEFQVFKTDQEILATSLLARKIWDIQKWNFVWNADFHLLL